MLIECRRACTLTCERHRKPCACAPIAARRARVTEAGASVAPATAPLLHTNRQSGDPADEI
jgi:hypothetical protein